MVSTMKKEIDLSKMDFYDIPPPNHSDYVMALAPIASWALASYLTWDAGIIPSLFNGACTAMASLAVIVLAQFLLSDPPSILFRDKGGRIFNSFFGLGSDRDPERCEVEDKVYEWLENEIKNGKKKNN